MQLSVVLVLSTLLVAYAREQTVLAAGTEDPTKMTPGTQYPAGKSWTQVAFTDEIAAPAMQPAPAKVPHHKKVEFVDPQYLDQAAFKNAGYAEGPVMESQVGTPDAESYNGMKVQGEDTQQQQQQQQQEEESQPEELKYTYPEMKNGKEPIDSIHFNVNEVPNADPNILRLSNTIAPEFHVSPTVDHKMTRAEYDAQTEVLRQEALGADEKLNSRLQAERQKLYSAWHQQKLKELSEQATKATIESDADKFLAPVEVDQHGHPTDQSLPIYPPYPGSENSGEQAFPSAPDYQPVDTQQARFHKLHASQAEGVEQFREKLHQLKKSAKA